MVTLPIVNPFHKYTCPSCGAKFYPGECAIYSSVTTGNELEPAKTGFWSRLWVPPLVGPKYTRELARRRCSTCENLFPYNIERANSYTIAIIGDVSSGKSHYLASCISLLKKYGLQVTGCKQIIGLDDTDERFSDNFYNPIYRDRQQIKPTPQATIKVNRPLVYELTFQKSSSLLPSKSLNLLFYDSSGEDIALANRMVQYSSYVAFASAIIFLVDPLTMPRIVDELPQFLRPARMRNSATEVFNRVLHTFSMTHGIAPDAAIKTPVAIAVSKSDLLKYPLKKERLQPYFLNDGVYTNALDTTMFKRIDDEVRDLLQRFDENDLLYASERFDKASFFAVSATGSAPNEKGRFDKIQPVRCLDPLLWAMWQLSIIK